MLFLASTQRNGVDFDLFFLKCNRLTRAGHIFRFHAMKMTSMLCFVPRLSSNERVLETVVFPDNYPSTRHIRCHRADTLLMRKLTLIKETDKKYHEIIKEQKIGKTAFKHLHNLFFFLFFIHTHSRLTQ